MTSNSPRENEYERMRGEYLSLMASLEFHLTFLLVEYLEVHNHEAEFRGWFLEAPIPFRSKVRLFERIMEGTMLEELHGDVLGDMREAYDFRNGLAHSFRQSASTTTARGKNVVEQRVSFEAISGKLLKLRALENLIGGMLLAALEGPPVPTSADDYADWPP